MPPNFTLVRKPRQSAPPAPRMKISVSNADLPLPGGAIQLEHSPRAMTFLISQGLGFASTRSLKKLRVMELSLGAGAGSAGTLAGATTVSAVDTDAVSAFSLILPVGCQSGASVQTLISSSLVRP